MRNYSNLSSDRYGSYTMYLKEREEEIRERIGIGD